MSGYRLPNLAALRCFEAVARHLSFTLAARELGITQAAVSRRVKALEDALSVRLIAREGGRNTLTGAGEILFAAGTGAFEAIELAVARITGTGAREILNVSVAPFFSAVWLTPRLMAFIRRHPGIDLRLHHSYRPADYRREQIHIGINWGAGVWPGVAKDKILDGALTPVMSPALAASKGPLTQPAQLLQFPLLYEFDVADWSAWFAASGVAVEGRPGQTPETGAFQTLRLNDSHALRRAAIDGHGVALFFAALIEDDVASGLLVQPFDATVHTGFDYYLNRPEDIEPSARTRAFRRWILDEAAAMRPSAA
jgi:DNA-binding transcriptional LysR family regulator